MTSPDTDPAVTISVFGGFRVWLAGEEVTTLTLRQRTVLAELVAADGNVVQLGELIDSVWGDSPPNSALNQVQRMVGQLRRMLQPELPAHAGGDLIHSVGAGYRLEPRLVRSDLGRFRRHVAEAEEAVRRGDPAAASQLYAVALDLAPGKAFAGLDPSVADRPEFAAVEQERVAVTNTAAGLAIEHGPAPCIVAAMERLTAGAPFDEALHARLMRLLAASGRRADALKVFDALRHRLTDELGVDPSPEVRRAHLDLLATDAAATPVVSADGPRRRPAQLPMRLLGFVGRPDAESILDRCLDAVGTTGAIAAIGGMAGIGKTTLAIQWAHEVVHRFPDGQLYVNLRGFDPSGRPLEVGEALSFMLEALSVSLKDFDARDVEATSALFRSRMAGRRMLVLLDNARDSEQVRALLPGSPHCLLTGGRTWGLLGAGLFLTCPRGFAVLESAWTEPYVLFWLAATMCCYRRWPAGTPWAFGLFLCSKQHMFLFAPAALWLMPRPLDWRQILMFFAKAAAIGLAVTLPFVAWNFKAFFHSVIELQLIYKARLDALSFPAYFVYHDWPALPRFTSLLLVPVAYLLAWWRIPKDLWGFALTLTFVAFCTLAFDQAFLNRNYFVMALMCFTVAALPTDVLPLSDVTPPARAVEVAALPV